MKQSKAIKTSKAIKIMGAKMLLVLSLGMASVSMAAPPTDAQIATLAKVSGIQEVMDGTFEQGFVAPIKANIATHPNYASLSAQDKKRLDDAVNTFANNVIKDLDMNKFQAGMLDAFNRVNKKYYSDKEVQALIDFYSSPMGKSVVAKQMPMMNEFMQEVMAYMTDPKITEQAIKSSAKYGMDFEQTVDAILEK